MNTNRLTDVNIIGKDGTRKSYLLDPDHYTGINVEWKEFVDNIDYVEIATKCEKCAGKNNSILENIEDGGSQERSMGWDSSIVISGNGLECQNCNSEYDVSVTLSHYAGGIIFIPDNTYRCDYTK